jgi:hypothetical protein
MLEGIQKLIWSYTKTKFPLSYSQKQIIHFLTYWWQLKLGFSIHISNILVGLSNGFLHVV